MDFVYGKIHGSMLEPVKLATVLGSQMTTSELAAAKSAPISDLSLVIQFRTNFINNSSCTSLTS